MSTVLWPNYIKPGESLTVGELLTMIEGSITILQATVGPRLTAIQGHAAKCRTETGASHEPADEHSPRDDAYDDLRRCRDALDLVIVYLQAAEDDISHVGGGSITASGASKASGGGTGKAKRKKKKRPGRRGKVIPKRKPKPKPNPRAKKKKKKTTKRK